MKKQLSAIAVSLALASGALAPAHATGIPVIDAANLSQNVMNTIEAVAQTLKQIEEYTLQLQQYENQLQNTMAPAANIWDQAQKTMQNLLAAVDTLEHYKRQMGDLDKYLSQFQDLNYYKSSPCFTAAGCSDAERAAIENVRQAASESQKKANDALFKGIDQQQTALKDDARQLERLQQAAQGAQGQMQALGFANQLASQQANQLLQIRGMLLAQQNAIGTRMQAQTDKEAQHEAAAENARRSTFEPSSKKGWKF